MTTEFDAAKTARMNPSIISFTEDELSEETKMKLTALGITITSDMTESEAEEIIEEMEEEKEFQPKAVQTSAINSDIKNLAVAIGLSYENTDTPEEIIAAIADELEAQIDESENNPQALSTLMGYYNRLSLLDAQLDGIKYGETKLFSAMDMMAQQNREEFGF